LSLARGQRMAALALGLTLPQAYVYVLLPMAYRIILPPLTSEFLNIIKNSSVALTIGLMELTARARAMQEFSFQVFEAFTAATVIYIVINVLVTYAMRQLERRVAVPGMIGAAAPLATH
jgi:glutamate/aspartate transport system permease protein